MVALIAVIAHAYSLYQSLAETDGQTAYFIVSR
jgi:hypothetical protein